MTAARRTLRILRVEDLQPADRQFLAIALAVVVVALLLAAVPVGIDKVFGSIVDDTGAPLAPTAGFLAGTSCLAVALWAAVRAVSGARVERGAIAVLGFLSCAVVGGSLRIVLDVVSLRSFYLPRGANLNGARIAAIYWIIVILATLVIGFVAPLAVGFAQLIPNRLSRHSKAIRRLQASRRMLFASLVALVIVMVIAEWLLPRALASAMGYAYPLPNGHRATLSMTELGASSWYSLNRLAVVPVLLGVLAGSEAARTAQRFADSQRAKRLQSLDQRVVVSLAMIVIVSAVALTRAIAAIVAGAILFYVLVRASSDPRKQSMAPPAFASKAARRWKLPDAWSDAHPIVWLLLLLLLPTASIIGADAGTNIAAVFRFPIDRVEFFSYWDSYGPTHLRLDANGIFGIFNLPLAVVGTFVLLVMVINGTTRKLASKDHHNLVVVARLVLVAFLLTAVIPACDHAWAPVLFGAELVAAAIVAGWSAARVARFSVAIGVVILVGISVRESSVLPAVAITAATIFQRFVLNADELNDENPRRANRIALQVALFALVTAMLVLDHGSVKGYFDTDALSAVGDHVAICLVALPWLLYLTTSDTRTSTTDVSVRT